MKKHIKIGFKSFWDSFDPSEFYITKFLEEDYIVEVTEDPDFLFFSDGLSQSELDLMREDICKIYYTFENRKIGSVRCDYAFTFNPETPDTNQSWFQHNGAIQTQEIADFLIKNNDKEDFKTTRNLFSKKFCCFVYSHDVPFRNWLFKQVSRYQKVDAPGLCMNNMEPITPGRLSKDRFAHFRPGWINEVIAFFHNYKFCIACENSSTPGYHTEKIIHAMLAGCIPIYWGDPLIHYEFNEKSFINYHYYERKVLEKIPNILFQIPKIRVLTKIVVQLIATYFMVRRIRKIDGDFNLYKQYLNEPWYIENIPTFYAKKEKMKKRLKIIFG